MDRIEITPNGIGYWTVICHDCDECLANFAPTRAAAEQLRDNHQCTHTQ